MSAKAETAVSVANPTRIVHYEDPRRKGEAWCGADVQGVYVFEAVECTVCAALRKASS